MVTSICASAPAFANIGTPASESKVIDNFISNSLGLISSLISVTLSMTLAAQLRVKAKPSPNKSFVAAITYFPELPRNSSS